MKNSNVHNTVDYLYKVCKEQGLDFMCYVGSDEENDAFMVAYTDSKLGLIKGVASCVDKDEGFMGFFKKIYQRLKKPYLWN